MNLLPSRTLNQTVLEKKTNGHSKSIFSEVPLPYTTAISSWIFRFLYIPVNLTKPIESN